MSETDGEFAHFTPGDHPSTFTLRGISCGVLICHEIRYPELYQEMEAESVRVVFHSFHAGNVPPERWRQMHEDVGSANLAHNPAGTLPGIVMPAGAIAAASNNNLWISAGNSSARESCWPAFVVRPDGVITGKLKRNVTGVLITDIDPNEPYYDSTAAWRRRAVEGRLHSGTPVQPTDPICSE